MARCISGMLASSTANGWSLVAAMRGWVDVRMSRSAVVKSLGVAVREGPNRWVSKRIMVVLVKLVWGSNLLSQTTFWTCPAAVLG